MWGKCTFHDPAYRVPLIIRDPRSMDAADKIVDRFTESIDIAPTILDWIGSKPPHEFDGRSLIPFLRGSSPDEWRGYIFAEFDYGDPVEPTRFQNRLGTHPTSRSCAKSGSNPSTSTPDCRRSRSTW